jgi:hypothetical protein
MVGLLKMVKRVVSAVETLTEPDWLLVLSAA